MSIWHFLLAGCAHTDPTPSTTAGEVAAPAAPEAPAPDLLIVPGTRVGPITAATTRDDLIAAFGADAVQDVEIDLGEGFTAPGVRVHDGEAAAVSVQWEGGVVTWLGDLGPAWRTADGLGVGSTLAELEAVAGPFSLLGYGWDYSGTVLLEGTRLQEQAGLLVFRMTPTAGDPDAAGVVGDAPYPSTSPAVVGLAPVVSDVLVLLR